MSVKSDKVKSGYTELSYAEREEVKKFIRDFDLSTLEQQRLFSRSLNESLNKSLGPLAQSGCPCCGR